MSSRNRLFPRLALFAAVLALVVIVLGAWVRLSDAGLGCPDWPGCYGQIKAPEEHHELAAAKEAYPHLDVHSGKAWKEMIHRYVAGILGLTILALAIIAFRHRKDPAQAVGLPLFLVLLVGFQAALGMWTVTLLLRPAIVTLHLITGMLTLALLWWTALRHRRPTNPTRSYTRSLRPWALGGLLILILQIALGGWTSTNYAALHCPDFPTCQGEWLPPMNFGEAFHLVGESGINYEGGRLSNSAAVTVHFTHRIGALITFCYLGLLALFSIRRGALRVRMAGMAVLALLLTQVTLGIANVLLLLPLPVAVAHNGVAALLLLSLVTLNHALRRETAGEQSTPVSERYAT